MSTEMNLAEAITYLRPIAESATVGHYAEALGLVLATAGFHRPAQTEPTDAQCDAITQALIDHDARSFTCYDHYRVCCPCGVHDMARLEWQRHRARAAFTAGQEEQS